MIPAAGLPVRAAIRLPSACWPGLGEPSAILGQPVYQSGRLIRPVRIIPHRPVRHWNTESDADFPGTLDARGTMLGAGTRLSDGGGFAMRLAGLYAAFFVVAGIAQPFFPVWLKAKGLDAGMIGLVLAAPMVVRVLAIPLATRQADRHDALRGGADRDQLRQRCRLCAGRFCRRRGGDLFRLCAGLAGLHAGDAAGRDLCAQGPDRARPRLWAGAAVGLGGLHPRQFRRRLCRRCHSGAAYHLDDRGGERRHRAGHFLAVAADDAGAGADRTLRTSAAVCCAIRPSSRCWRRRA